MQAIILAAGRGNRLHPLTKGRSKAMVPVMGKPIIARIMDTLIEIGIKDFILVTDPFDRQIHHYFSSNIQYQSKNIEVQFVHQYEKLGMAHALQMAEPLINGPFILSACDNLVPKMDVLQVKQILERGANGVLVLLEVPLEEISNISTVEFDGNWVHKIVEKPIPEQACSNLASISLYGFSSKLLKYLPEVPLSNRGEYELQDAVQFLINNDGNVKGFLIRSRLTLTDIKDFLKINQFYLSGLSKGKKIHLETKPPENTKILAPVWIDKGVEIGEGCQIGPGVYLESGSRVGKQAILVDAVVLNGAIIPDGAVISKQVVF